VAVVQRGKITASGTLHDLLRPEVRRVEIELSGVDAPLRAELAAQATEVRDLHQRILFVVEGDAKVPGLLELAIRRGAQVLAVIPHRETLEDLFMRKAMEAPS
jgi:ABC-2 type transport system ATP-binding protein